MIKYIDDLIDKLKNIVETENNGERIKASRMLRDIDAEYSVINLENRNLCSEFIYKYQQRYKLEFRK